MYNKEKISFFLPTRKGSKRVKNKNIKPFAGYKGGLLELKLTQLTKSKEIDQIVFSTNCEASIEIAEDFRKKDHRLIIDKRPEKYCLDSTPLSLLISYVGEIVNSEHICWGHVTTPFASHKIYDDAIKTYFHLLNEGKCDSLVSVEEVRNFFINKEGKLINYEGEDGLKWPRTQDLDPIYEVNHAMFINSKKNYKQMNDRLGNNYHLYKMGKIESFDIDWEEDFVIAESLYKYLFAND